MLRLKDGGKVVSPTHQPHFTPQKHYYFNASGKYACCNSLQKLLPSHLTPKKRKN
jgi:hypothetical protein